MAYLRNSPRRSQAWRSLPCSLREHERVAVGQPNSVRPRSPPPEPGPQKCNTEKTVVFEDDSDGLPPTWKSTTAS